MRKLIVAIIFYVICSGISLYLYLEDEKKENGKLETRDFCFYIFVNLFGPVSLGAMFIYKLYKKLFDRFGGNNEA